MVEEELIYLIRCGNEWAFHVLYSYFVSLVKSVYADIIIDKNIYLESDDIIQSVSSKFWTILTYYRGDKNNTYHTYIHKCVRNQIYTEIRSYYKHLSLNHLSLDYLIGKTRQSSIGDVILTIPDGDIPDAMLLMKEEQEEYDRDIKALLTSKEYDIYVYSMNGYTMNEISDILKISLKSVYNGMYRATKKISNRNIQLTIRKKYDKLN